MIVLACEGKTERELIKRLLEEGKMSFSREEVFDYGPIHSRQLKEYRSMLQSIDFQEHICIKRIGDTLNDELMLPFFQQRIALGLVEVERYCTKPEIEILAIIAKGWIKEFGKHRLGPKSFLRQFHPEFDFMDFIQNEPISTLVDSIFEYKRIKKHTNGLCYLADLIVR